jgi:protein-tyrosine phosphatase
MFRILRVNLLALLLAVAVSTSVPLALVQTLPQLEAGQSLGHALGLKAATNLRDLGGYKTADGSTVARGLLYRSDVFNPMSEQDIAKLQRIGLKSNYDLRTDPEIKKQPDQVPAGIEYVHLDVLADAQSAAPAQLEALMGDPKKASVALGGGKLEAEFAKGYRDFVSLPSAKRAYRELFLSITDISKLPAVFHCTTGKDRTGWAAAALLTLLGVPKETVMADYLRTNEYLLPYYKKTIDGFVAKGGDRSIPIAIFGVKREYLEAAFDEMQKKYGSIENYFSQGLGIDAVGQKALRDVYLKQ